jgi:hypothetical protein
LPGGVAGATIVSSAYMELGEWALFPLKFVDHLPGASTCIGSRPFIRTL